MKSLRMLVVLGGLLALLAGCQKEAPAPTAPPKGATAINVGGAGAPTGATSTQISAPAKPAGAPP